MARIFVVAHRGASKLHHENTVPAHNKAIKLGADFIELDVRKTIDGVFVIHHDDNVGALKISKTKFLELSLEARILGYRIPTLNQVLKNSKGKIKLDIELKEQGYENEITKLMLSHFKYKQFVITSFHENTLRKIKRIDKKIRCGLLCGLFGELLKINNVFK